MQTLHDSIVICDPLYAACVFSAPLGATLLILRFFCVRRGFSVACAMRILLFLLYKIRGFLSLLSNHAPVYFSAKLCFFNNVVYSLFITLSSSYSSLTVIHYKKIKKTQVRKCTIAHFETQKQNTKTLK
jgi:hypothetical protein